MASRSIENYDPNKVGVTVFLISESVFFIFLIIAYAYFHGDVRSGPKAANSLDPLRSGFYTAALLASSFTMWRAERSFRRSRSVPFRVWMWITVLLGFAFLIGQGLEYRKLYGRNISISRNIFSTSFFTLTGFHGLHVLLGLVILSVLIVLAYSRDLHPGHSSAVETAAIYWHFVDWVWVLIFSEVYLWTST